MESEVSRVIVSPGPAGGTVRVHHRDFPEIRSEASSPSDAAGHLVHHLVRALDTALTAWRRESIEKAIADVREFAGRDPAPGGP